MPQLPSPCLRPRALHVQSLMLQLLKPVGPGAVPCNRSRHRNEQLQSLMLQLLTPMGLGAVPCNRSRHRNEQLQSLMLQLLKPVGPGAVPCNRSRHCNEKPVQPRVSPCSPQLEKAQEQQRRPSRVKNKKRKNV